MDEYQATKILPIIKMTAYLINKNPDAGKPENFDFLLSSLIANIPELKDKTKCSGCGRSMKVTIYEADLLDGLLVYAMAKQVKYNLSQGIPFTEANKVHIPTLGATQGILKRQTKCDYLGIIKQPENWRGSGHWLLTGWAWKLLRGEEIPEAVKYWEGNMLARSQRTTTMEKMFGKHRELISSQIAMRKAIKSDHRTVFEDYKPSDWTEQAIGSYYDPRVKLFHA